MRSSSVGGEEEVGLFFDGSQVSFSILKNKLPPTNTLYK